MRNTQATLYGKGIFTTIRITDSKPLFWEKHRRRLVSNAAAIGLDLSGHPEHLVLRSLVKLIEKDKIINGKARLTFTDRSPSRIWSEHTDAGTELSIITSSLRRVLKEFKLTVSAFRVNTLSPLAGVKSCNYLENVLALENAAMNGFNEAIRLNERGEITSACMANIFWQSGRTLFTPSLKTGCLAGTTREFVLENLECVETIASVEEIAAADQLFLTSAGIGIVRVSELDGRRLIDTTHSIQELLPLMATESQKARIDSV